MSIKGLLECGLWVWSTYSRYSCLKHSEASVLPVVHPSLWYFCNTSCGIHPRIYNIFYNQKIIHNHRRESYINSSISQSDLKS